MRLLASGKVRELYEVDDQRLLMVASDRISAYDVVLPTQIPGKGAVLTALSVWWFEQLATARPHHLISAGDGVPGEFQGRGLLVQRLSMLPMECVARGYLAGSAVTEYAESGAVCGVRLPAGLRDGDRLPEPIFTPATKAAVGEHDENVSFDSVVEALGGDFAERVRERTLAIYVEAAARAERNGILLADTKFEFGVLADEVVLGDEVLTPDSSRLWPADQWRPGAAQPSYDKQFLRDWLTHESGWNRIAPGPSLPADVVAATRERYIQAYEQLTGLSFADWPTAAR